MLKLSGSVNSGWPMVLLRSRCVQLSPGEYHGCDLDAETSRAREHSQLVEGARRGIQHGSATAGRWKQHSH